jgi:hypothetical protein
MQWAGSTCLPDARRGGKSSAPLALPLSGFPLNWIFLFLFVQVAVHNPEILHLENPRLHSMTLLPHLIREFLSSPAGLLQDG